MIRNFQIARLLILLAFILIVIVGFINNAEFTRGLVEVIAIILAAIVAIFIYVNFSPKITLRVIPTWIDKDKGILKIRTEIENVSRVVCIKKRIRFQILEQKFDGNLINEFVAFDESKIDLMNPKPEHFSPAEEINKSTSHFYPGEIVAVERLYRVNSSLIQHLGLQFEADLGIMKFVMRILRGIPEQWTTTMIVTKDQT